MLPVLLGGLVGLGAGYAIKKYYDENEIEVNDKIENCLTSIDEWFDEKSVALDKYLDSSNSKENKVQLEEEIVLGSLSQMKKKVYHDSLVDFISLYEKIENVDFGKLDYRDINFDSKAYGDEIFNKTVQNNIKITTDLIKKSPDYNDFETREKELLREAFSLARFIEKVCVNDSITEDVVVKFNSIISSL